MTNITALVVDNEPGFAELACEMLERERDAIDAEPATSTVDALERLEATGAPPVDCIVSDYAMPRMTGLELLEQVRAVDPDLPFILFTGRGSEAVASEAIDAGVTQYLQKRAESEQYAVLAAEIVNAVEQYRTENELQENERRYQRTVTALHETARDLMRAESKDEIYRTAVETGREDLDVPVVVAYAFDSSEGALELSASSERTVGTEPKSGEAPAVTPETPTGTTGLDPAPRFERGDGVVWEVFSEGETTTCDGTDAVRATAVEDDDPAVRNWSELVVPLGTHGVLVAGTDDTDGFDGAKTELLHVLSANVEAALDRAEREDLLRERDRTLTQQNEELSRLNHTNSVVREINHGIAQASTRPEIETTVCERLANTDRYQFAWIATADEPPEPTTWAGVDATYVDKLHEEGDRAPEVALVRDALESNCVCVVDDVLEAEGWDHRRKEALTHGYQTVLAVPLSDEERRRGVLVVHVDGVGSIGDREREVFAELGETIGYALRSVERARAMLIDSRIELELECRDDRLLLNRLSNWSGGRVTLEGVIDRGDGDVVSFVSAPDTVSPATLEEESAVVERATVVSEGDELLLEATTGPTPFLEVLHSYDVRLQSVASEGGVATLTLAVPKQIDTRELVESIRVEYPETELQARRETTATPSTRQLDTYLEQRLTDRQFEALQAAHYGGFFSWPRETTAEELAEVLSVSPPTYHYHLRAAERKLVSLAFDGI
ncbi:bacterio-opsin activator domain-containing protein [Natronobacterium gregoryi]|nr:bacterio-opsin activator domain-containing protein [Natronobacterium gregoryi]AFZ72856.1 response regulator with CheY-like receiver, AAA-type ATPase, and DNA-binding domains [Natronobacterium gregoryi SP2]PLK21936.1 diguanylate cyclase [Natronobacterium gregoryi SP2]SFI65850.1 GAF domain-containing protein [Natronobacterium gregoryi]